jgi:hypothetical protein
MAVSPGLLAANWRRSPRQYDLIICHYYSLPGNAVDTSGVLIFYLVSPQKVAEITPFPPPAILGALTGGEFLTGRAYFAAATLITEVASLVSLLSVSDSSVNVV